VTAERVSILHRRCATNRPLSPRSRWFHLAKSTRNHRRASQASRPVTKRTRRLRKIRFNRNSRMPCCVRYLSQYRGIRRNSGVRLNTALQKNIVPVHRVCANNGHERTMLHDSDAALSRSMPDTIARFVKVAQDDTCRKHIHFDRITFFGLSKEFARSRSRSCPAGS